MQSIANDLHTQIWEVWDSHLNEYGYTLSEREMSKKSVRIIVYLKN